MNEHPVAIPTPDGLRLAGRAATPTAPTGRAVVCHPHPRFGGTMDNPVVAAAVERAARRRLATLRFDFRGAGASPGRHDDGRAEVTDVAAALAFADTLHGGGERVLVGYSFGAAVAAAAVRAGAAVDRLVLVAPPVTLMPVVLPPAPPRGLWLLVGDHDGWCPRAAAIEIVPRQRLRVVPGADHFFGHTMDALCASLDEVLR